ncbi:MAG: L-threonylcarbamoyladenylate synthase [Bacillota bacterium]
METLLWKVDVQNPDGSIIKTAAGIIKKGGLVAFPTETVYGLGANGLSPEAVARIFRAKGRPSDNPLILHIADVHAVYTLAKDIPPAAFRVMERFWPGPLTLVLPKQDVIPREVTAGLATVALRMPSHPVALALIREAGVPVAAPSANRSGLPSPTTAQHVWDDLAGKIEAILDSGPTGVGLESTVLDLTEDRPVILRPGGITTEDLQEVLGEVSVDPGLAAPEAVPKAPGMKYTHYSPQAEVILVEGTPENVSRKIRELVERYTRQGKKIGLLLTDETWRLLGSLPVTYGKNMGTRLNLAGIARIIYGELRYCDQVGVDVIFTETYSQEGLGSALMNRLLKSAGYHVINA